MESNEIILRKPTAEDGMDVFDLVERCAPLDPNSSYCNLLQCSHFSDTAVAAEKQGELVGFVSGYQIPGRQEPTWFVWQVAVDAKARGLGLAKKMVVEVLNRADMQSVKYIETTITPDNEASWALFRSLAKQLDAPLEDSVMFDETKHFKGRHGTEHLVRIGPFNLAGH